MSRKGGFEGGFHDDRTSKIASVMKIRAATAAMASLQEREGELKARCDAAETAVNDVLRDLQGLEAQRDHVRTKAWQISKELASLGRQHETALANIEKRRSGFVAMEGEIAAARQQVAEYEAEMLCELNVALTTAERNELRSLVEKVQNLQEEVSAVEGDVLSLATKREGLKADLRDNLLKRQAELQASLSSLGEQGAPGTSSSSTRSSGSSRRGRRQGGASAVSASVSEEDTVRAELDRAELVVRELEAELEVLDAKIQEKRMEVRGHYVLCSVISVLGDTE